MALQMISSVSGRTVIEILAGLVRFAFGEKVRDQVLVQLSGGDFSAKQLIKVLTDVAEAQGRARQAAEQPHPVTLTQNPVSPNPYAAQPRTLDIAGTLPRRDDDMIPATFGNGGQ